MLSGILKSTFDFSHIFTEFLYTILSSVLINIFLSCFTIFSPGVTVTPLHRRAGMGEEQYQKVFIPIFFSDSAI